MRLRLLGTAAGGGSPQWNCACVQCAQSRGSGIARTQECALLDGQYLINASPDIRTQLLAAPELTPGPGRRETPLKGVLLTDAELDHTLGLFSLREAESLTVYGTPAMLEAIESCLPVKAMSGASWHPVYPGREFELGHLVVTTIPLGDKKPRYAADVTSTGWVVGYRIEDQAGQVIVYAPCFGGWSQALDSAIEGADIAVIDGTFFSTDEMPTVQGHLSIQDSLPHLDRHPGTRFIFTHLNNTNPLLADPKGLPLAGEMELL